jgi:hypothetical protein
MLIHINHSHMPILLQISHHLSHILFLIKHSLPPHLSLPSPLIHHPTLNLVLFLFPLPLPLFPLSKLNHQCSPAIPKSHPLSHLHPLYTDIIHLTTISDQTFIHSYDLFRFFQLLFYHLQCYLQERTSHSQMTQWIHITYHYRWVWLRHSCHHPHCITWRVLHTMEYHLTVWHWWYEYFLHFFLFLLLLSKSILYYIILYYKIK